MKNRIKNIIVATALLAGTASFAEGSYGYSAKSLVGIEGGYSNIDYESGLQYNNLAQKLSSGHIGFKLGAETEDFRFFLTSAYYTAGSEYDYLYTYGAALQYKFNASKYFNFYIGANGGMLDSKFRAEDINGVAETFSRTITSPYFGGDVGTNIHLNNNFDLELGARVMSVQSTSTEQNVSYKLGNIVSAYGSLIFKWQMN